MAATETAGLLTAMLAVQSEAPTLKKSAANPAFKGSKYAPLDEIVETVGPILIKHGLVWSTLPGSDTQGQPSLTYRLSHAPTGESIEGTMPLLLSKDDAQGQGSAITYARRYSLCAVLNLVADDDDDGNAVVAGRSGGGRVASEKQIKFVQKLLKEKKLTAAEIRVLLTECGVRGTENVVDDVAALTDAEASKVIDRLVNGPVKTGGSDVPNDAGDFTRVPVGLDPSLPFDPGVPA